MDCEPRPTDAETRILVVDDDREVRDQLQLLLTRDGYRVTTAADGAEALVHLQRSPSPSLIILDLVMPRVDGRACLDAVEANPTLAAIPVVVLSADPYPLPRGARAALPKPCVSEELLATVKRLVAGERRCSPRYPARFEMTARDGDGEAQALALNLSRGGILFRSALGAAKGQSLTLTLAIDADSRITVESEVRHASFELGGWHVGARFVNVRDGGDVLDRVLHQLQLGA
jgi:CheY-like chemotaxis protein